MATKTFEELKQLAIQIRDEKTNKQNTATRVGTAMLEHINKLEQDYYDKTKTDEELKERDDKLTELDNKLGNITLSVNVQSGYSKRVISLSDFENKKVIVIVTGSFTQFGYYNGESESDFIVLGNSTKSGIPIEFTVQSGAKEFFVYNTSEVGTTIVNVKLFVNNGYEIRKNSEEIEAIINNSLIGFGFGYGGYVEMNFKEKKFSTNFQYVACNTAIYTPENSIEKDYTVNEAAGVWFLMFNILNKEFNVYYYNTLPEDKINNFIIATGINNEIVFSTSSINPSQKILEDLKKEIENIKNVLGGKIYKNSVIVESGMAEKVVSLAGYAGKQAIAKVIGKFTQFGYYYGDSEEFTVIGRKSDELIEFQIPRNAKDFFVYNTSIIGTTEVEVEIYLQKDDKSNSLIYEIEGNLKYKIEDIYNKIENLPISAIDDSDLLEKVGENPLSQIKTNPGFASLFKDWGFIGDSMSSATFNTRSGGSTQYDYSWPQYLCRLCGVVGYNFTIPGITTKTWLASSSERGWKGCSVSPKKSYIIALGCNDADTGSSSFLPVGDIATDVDFEDFRNNNGNTFAGNYAGIIQRVKSISPQAKIFCVTLPQGDRALANNYNAVIRGLVDKFDNVFLIDLWTYAKPVNGVWAQKYREGYHLNTAGYLYTAYEMMTYIDWHVRRNPLAFRDVGLIGTNQQMSGQYKISGTITNGENAFISIVNESVKAYTTSGNSGNYAYYWLPAGTYNVYVHKEGRTIYRDSVTITNVDIQKNITL